MARRAAFFAGVVVTAGRRAWVCCLYGFSLGALIAWFQHDSIAEARQALGGGAGRLAWTLAELVMIAVIGLFVSIAGTNDAGIVAPFVFALALCLFAHEGGWISTLLHCRPMLLLGSLSYSTYMVHIFVQARMINVGGLIERELGHGIVGDMTLRGDAVTGFGVGSPWIGVAAIVAMLVAVIVVSWFTWRFVEMPALAWSRRLAKRI